MEIGLNYIAGVAFNEKLPINVFLAIVFAEIEALLLNGTVFEIVITKIVVLIFQLTQN